ncbi:ABC transporter substrate-binding protein [Brevibacillus humidisoli]|uniref:ABC transporter substrate-binding protein n=1 Tax=Brevibacillus humidisoli TaxID=2895522 RepID=UPI001E2F80CF|nr:ABC transporter substrate-binding protein [Brevibacillus humidisoli]UFJ39575.1 ABC transporter substrate-binding protein [Brevibacillus humidisoli]
MSIVLDYIKLRQTFPIAEEGEPLRVTMAQLAEIWYCTPRNAKLMINKMEQLNWLSYTPGRGRGIASTIRFHYPSDQLLLAEAEKRVRQGKLHQALELLRTYGDGTTLQRSFLLLLNQSLGHQVESNEGERLETLRLPIARTINALDPADGFFALDLHLIKQVYDTLIAYDYKQQRHLPMLAHHWESNRTCSDWVFYLRKGVRFHHGKECTADDVAYTMERLQRSSRDGGANGWLLQTVNRIRLLDRYTIQLTLSAPNRLFAPFLSLPAASVVPADLASLPFRPVGTGPFRVFEYTDHHCILEANPDYFYGRAHLDRIEILSVSAQQANALLSQETSQLFVHTGETARPSHSSWRSRDFPFASCSLLTFNLARPGPQADIRFRQALHLLLDRHKMIDELGELRVAPATGFHERGGTGQEQSPVTLSAMEAAANLQKGRRLLEDSEKVWASLTENEQLAKWFPELRMDELREGGVITFDMQDGTFEELRIIEFAMYSVLEYTWGDDQVRFELYPDGEGCRLVLIEKINKITDHTPKDLAGWHVCLDVIEALLDGSTLEDRKNEWEKWHEKYVQVIEKLPKGESEM